jgi:hypothetical protein
MQLRANRRGMITLKSSIIAICFLVTALLWKNLYRLNRAKINVGYSAISVELLSQS